MSNKSNRSDLTSGKNHAEKKARRRELYHLKQSDKKAAFLAQARANLSASDRSSIGASSSTILCKKKRRQHCTHGIALLKAIDNLGIIGPNGDTLTKARIQRRRCNQIGWVSVET